MTEQNMKELYEFYIENGQTERAKKISDIPRYSKFSEPKVEPKETKSKKEK